MFRRLLMAAALAVSVGHAQTPEAALVAVEVSADLQHGGARIVLTHDRVVSYRVVAHPNRLEVVYGGAVRVSPAARDLSHAAAASWSFDGERTVTVRLGNAFAGYDSFELKNPPRLVLDLRADPTKAAMPAPAAPPPSSPRASSRPVVVLDPGHGGVEDGAVGARGVVEKEAVLDIAVRLKTRLAAAGVDAVLTRDTDRLVTLDERAAVANHNRAELFVSIHLNASPRAQAFGAETYFLSSDASDDEARWLAAEENSPRGEVPIVVGDARERGLDLVLWDLAQTQAMVESEALAGEVQLELNALAGTRDRGVRQAPFRVLMGATMPAILVEVGFVSNPEEERRLAISEYRDRIAEALGVSILRFLGKTVPAQASRP